MKKKYLSMLIAAAMVFTLAGCGGKAGGAVNAGGGGDNGDSGSNVSSNVDDNNTNSDNNGGDSGNGSSNNDNPVSVGQTTDVPDNDDSGSSGSGKKKYEATWDGVYLADAYYFKGYLNVEPADNGDVKFSLILGDYTKDYTGKEENYDFSSYDYGDYMYAEVKPNDNTFFRYNADPDHEYIEFSGQAPTADGSTEDMWISFFKFDGSPHKAPKDYDDSDRFGMIARTDADDSSYYFADTDDYIIEYSKSSSMWDGDDSTPCEEYNLYSFSEAGVEVGNRKTKFVFEDAADAKRSYDYQVQSYGSSDYYKFYLSDNIIYRFYSDGGNSKITTAYNWYADCNYAFASTDMDYLHYYYMSKPISSSVYNLSLEDLLYYRMVSGEHRSLDTKDATLNVSISESDTYIYVYDSSDDAMKGNGYYLAKIDGRTLVSITADHYYHYNGKGYDYAIIVQEYSFDDTEATVTEYQFEVDDFATADITLDNYKSREADKTLSHRFDMTKVINN